LLKTKRTVEKLRSHVEQKTYISPFSDFSKQ